MSWVTVVSKGPLLTDISTDLRCMCVYLLGGFLSASCLPYLIRVVCMDFQCSLSPSVPAYAVR